MNEIKILNGVTNIQLEKWKNLIRWFASGYFPRKTELHIQRTTKR